MPAVAKLTHYRLICRTCDEVFPPLVGTRTGELVSPDWDQVTEDAGENNRSSLQAFHEQHRDHNLEEEAID